ncbi:MAG: hypothetical protein M3305_11435 [Actinomycetota bacterium]|nr:hypothetical protein [Actinomycetota bacterium]
MPLQNCALARIEGSRLITRGELPDRFSELDPAADRVVIRHHGALGDARFAKVLNLEGGLDAYSDVDQSVPRY